MLSYIDLDRVHGLGYSATGDDITTGVVLREGGAGVGLRRFVPGECNVFEFSVVESYEDVPVDWLTGGDVIVPAGGSDVLVASVN